MREYDSLKSNMARPKEFGEQSAKFYEAITCFESYLNRFKQEKEGLSDGS